MDAQAMLDEWTRFGQAVRRRIVALISMISADVHVDIDKKVSLLGLCLLCRTATNFKGVMILLEHRLIIEAQIILRSCFENSILARRLAKEGRSFVAEIADDALHNEAALAKIISESVKGDKERAARFAEHIKAGKGAKRITTRPSDLSDGAEEDYAFFRHFSLSAAHPSLTSLLRHMATNTGPDDRETVVEVPATERDLVAATFFAVSAMIHSLASFVQTVPTEAGENLFNELTKEFNALDAAHGTTAFVSGD
jgi:hypothetical protein